MISDIAQDQMKTDGPISLLAMLVIEFTKQPNGNQRPYRVAPFYPCPEVAVLFCDGAFLGKVNEFLPESPVSNEFNRARFQSLKVGFPPVDLLLWLFH